MATFSKGVIVAASAVGKTVADKPVTAFTEVVVCRKLNVSSGFFVHSFSVHSTSSSRGRPNSRSSSRRPSRPGSASAAVAPRKGQIQICLILEQKSCAQSLVKSCTKLPKHARGCKEKRHSMLRTQSSFGSFKETPESVIAGVEAEVTPPVAEIKNWQPFLQDDVLVELMKVDLPGSAEHVLRRCFSGSEFTEAYRAIRKDTGLLIEPWHSTEEYRGEVRKITFRAPLSNPMCPPDTAITEYQHFHLQEDKRVLLFETVQQCHDVPFGSYFEVHVKWTFETTSDTSCSLVVKVGAHFKKWCLMQGKIKDGSMKEYKGDAELIISTAKRFLEDAIKASESNGKSGILPEIETGDQTIDIRLPSGDVTANQKIQGSPPN